MIGEQFLDKPGLEDGPYSLLACVHCRQEIPMNAIDHWRTCPNHPASAEVRRMRVQITKQERAIKQLSRVVRQFADKEALSIRFNAVKYMSKEDVEKKVASDSLIAGLRRILAQVDAVLEQGDISGK